MNAIKLIIIVSCLLIRSVHAVTNEVALTLCFPYTEMLADEWFDYSITISNGSSRLIQIIKDPQSMLLCQMIFDLGTKKEYRDSHYSFDDGWDKRKSFRASRKNTTSLLPGKSYTWLIPYGYSDLHGAIKTFGVTNMSVRCLLGTNEWVRSNVVPLTFYQEETGGQSIGSLRKVKLGGKRYVFNKFNQRICEIPEDDDPLISISNINDTVSIVFSKSKRKLLYDQGKMKITSERPLK